MRPKRSILIPIALAALIAASGSRAEAGAADEWLDSLYDHVAADLTDGEPLVVHAHVPLCDNNIIRCGRRGLGDGDNPRTNLYWSTSGGFIGWFGRRGSGWKSVYTAPHRDRDILEVRVWQRRFKPSKAWRARGVTRSFDAYVVAYAWRGSAINLSMDAYVNDLFGDDPRLITLDDKRKIRAGGAAHIVAYVGHNGWMDIARYDWKPARKRAEASQGKKGTIAVACITADYIASDVSSERRVPLLMTKTLLFAGAHSFEGAVSEFARAGSMAGIRRQAVRSYAKGQNKTERRVRSAFTNPSDKRWRY